MAVEARRACGYRKVGGLYLVSGQLAEPCHRLPFPLTVCPVCGSGFKPARGWTWVNPLPLFAPRACWPAFTVQHCERCLICTPSRWPRTGDEPRAGLLWVGEHFYDTPATFTREAEQLGISRRISHVPHDFQLGVTWVLLAHRRAVVTVRGLDVTFGASAADFKAGPGEPTEWVPGIFSVFLPERIEKLVTQSQLTEGAQRAAAARGITLVPVPDEDRDHQGSVYDDEQLSMPTDPEPPEREGPPYTDAVDDEDGLSELERDTREPPEWDGPHA